MRAMIRFGKQSRLRFISHLDLQRFFQRALNRTGLPIAYSQGFSPHPLLSFGSALALGWTSEYEIIDVKLAVPMGKKRTEEAMRSALPEDLPVLAVRQATLEAVETFLSRDQVMAVRKTKSGEREIDVRPLAIALEPTPSGLSARLRLTEKDALKPDLLVRTLAQLSGVEPPEARIHRKCLLGEDKDGTLKPLMEL